METWLNSDGKDCIVEGNVYPDGHSLTHVPRSHGKEGGVALKLSTLKVTKLSTEAYHSFELFSVKVISKLNDSIDLSSSIVHHQIGKISSQ